jgi:TonB family protein
MCATVCCDDGAAAASPTPAPATTSAPTTSPAPAASSVTADECPFVLQMDSVDGKTYAAIFYGPAAVTAAIDLRFYAKDADYVAHIPQVELSTPYPIGDGRTWFRSALLSLTKSSGQPLVAVTADSTLGAASAPCEPRGKLIPAPLAVIASRKGSAPLPSPAMRIALARTTSTHFDCNTPPYPPDALRARQGGKARILVSLDEAGTVTGTSLLASTGVPSLDAAALAGARGTSYVPQRFACKTEPGSYVFRVDFSP